MASKRKKFFSKNAKKKIVKMVEKCEKFELITKMHQKCTDKLQKKKHRYTSTHKKKTFSQNAVQ